MFRYDHKTTWKDAQIQFIGAQGPTYLHNEKKEKGNIFLFTLEPRASGIGSKLRDAARWTFSHKYRSYSLCTNAFNCARLRSEAEIGKYDCAGSTRRCWQGSRRKKSGKNGVWRRQQLSSIIPGSLALFSSEASLYLVVPECALWTINGAKAAHTRIHPAVLFLHNVIL